RAEQAGLDRIAHQKETADREGEAADPDEGGRSVEARVSEAVADRAYIPGVLTAAGIIAAFATVYAAYALYGFIGDALAFVGLGAAGFLGLALSVRQGPWIAAVGLAAGYVTPALVSSSSPSAAALFIYLLVLTAAVYLTAWLRGWRELAYLAAIGSTGWGLLWLVDVYRAADAPVLIGYCILLPALAIALLRRGTEQPVGDEATSDEQADPAPSKLSTRIIKAIRAGADPIVTPIVAANAFLTLAFVTVSGHGVLAIIGTAGVAALLVAAALALPGLRSLAAIAGTLFISHLASWPRPLGFVAADPLNPSSSSTGEMLWVRRVEDPEAMIWFALIGAVVLGGVALWNVFTRTAWPVWAALASAVPVLAYVLTYLATGAGQTSIPFALTALFSAALFATATDRLDRRRLDVAAPDRRTAQAVGALAAAACAFLALAMAVSLNQGWLTIGLAMMAPALAWIDRKRDLPILRAIVAVLAAIVVARLIWRPDIVGDDLGTTPIFNWALYGYGVPTVAFALAAWWLERTRDDVSAKLARGAAIAFLAALIGVQVRHLINGGDVLANRYGLQEAALHTLSWLGLSLGLRWGAFRRDDGLMLQAANLFGLLSLAHIATVHLVRLLPFVTEAPIEGGVILNTLLLAYFLPSVLAGLTVMQFQKRQQALPDGGVPGLPWSPRSVADLYVLVTAVFTVLLIFAYLTLQVSRVFQGPILDAAPSDGELYAWSLVWVVFAVCLLGGGIGWQVSALRQAGFAFLTLATCKIFLFDMAALTGLLRALSFIGLGAALMGIGFAYQRLMGRASATT
ncbi:MAG: DUF2339 domain-containing protein, partial [Pseudomonadota bacterium]